MPQVKYTKEKGLHQVTGNGTRGLLRREIITLASAGSATTVRSAITEEESGALFLVPQIAGGNQTISLPALTDSLVGCYWDFLALADGNTSHTFLVTTPESATKFFAVALPDGDGTSTVAATADKVGFTANYDQGAKFRITCVSSTPATAYHVEFLADGLAAATGEFAQS